MIKTPSGMKLYTVKEVAEMMHMSESSVRDCIHDGSLEGRTRRGTSRPILISEKALQDWWDTGYEIIDGSMCVY